MNLQNSMSVFLLLIIYNDHWHFIYLVLAILTTLQLDCFDSPPNFKEILISSLPHPLSKPFSPSSKNELYQFQHSSPLHPLNGPKPPPMMSAKELGIMGLITMWNLLQKETRPSLGPSPLPKRFWWFNLMIVLNTTLEGRGSGLVMAVGWWVLHVDSLQGRASKYGIGCIDLDCGIPEPLESSP